MGKKIFYSAFIGVILALCLVPSAGMLLASDGETGGNEVLSALPAPVDGEGRVNWSYLSQLTDYVEDNYFLRQDLVTAWSALNEELLASSAAEDVVLGRDGWLYFAPTLADYTGTEVLSAREIFSAARNLRLMSDYCESLGADFLFTVAPNKSSLYPEHMPPLTRYEASANAKALAEALAGEGVAYLDLFAALGGEEETLYFTRDSHWNSRGAALAADRLNGALGRSSDYFAGPFAPQAVHESDLHAMLYPRGSWLEEDQVYGGDLRFTYDAPVRSAESLTIPTTGERGQGSLLMFRDSFGNLLYPYLADSFESALFSRAVAYRLDLAAQRQADCVVVELVERNIRYLIENAPVLPAPLCGTGTVDFLGQSEARLTAEPMAELPGCVRLSGKLPDEPTDRSAVYLAAEGGWYEACLLGEDGFSLCVPEDLLAEDLSLVFTAQVGAVSFPAACAET